MANARQVIAVVADCSIRVKGELPGEAYAAEAMELTRDWDAGAIEIHVVDLIPSEIGSVFLKALRRGRITAGRARVSIERLLDMPFTLRASQPLVIRAFDIADRNNQRIHDCFSVALAELDGVDFWTADERLCNALTT